MEAVGCAGENRAASPRFKRKKGIGMINVQR